MVAANDDVAAAEPWTAIDGADTRIVTSSGKSISVHSSVLAPVSPVLERMMLDKRRPGKTRNVPILGVPYDAVVVFLRCLYSSRKLTEEETEKYGVHLLVLSHVMRVGWLKRAVTMGLVSLLVTENVVDMLQLARQCDAPRLHVRCMNMIRRQYKAVEQTEGWKFVQEHDPWLELEVLQFLQEEDHREKHRMRMKRETAVYTDLSESMECLRHICTEGCTMVGPWDQPWTTKTQGCRWGNTCEGLQQLIRHFAVCERKKKPVLGDGSGCTRCSRMWLLLRLHSTICDQNETCKVPLCSRFKEKKEGKKEDAQWNLLAKKVLSAKVFSALNKRKREDEVLNSCASKRS